MDRVSLYRFGIVVGSGPFDLTFGGKVGSLTLSSKSDIHTKGIKSSGSVHISGGGKLFAGGSIVSGDTPPAPVDLSGCS
jgi:hypothetical protein